MTLIIDESYLLISGVLQTLYVAFWSLLFSLACGLIIGFLRTLKSKPLLFIGRLHLEAFRIIPLIVWLFAVFFTLPRMLGFSISGQFTAVFVFTLWGAAEMGEMVRAALISLPIIQKESGTALGLSPMQLFVYILLPQALRRMLPGIINMATRLIKTSSMAFLVGVLDLVSRGQQIIERTNEPLIIYTFLFFMFFLLCWPLSLLSKRLEKRHV